MISHQSFDSHVTRRSPARLLSLIALGAATMLTIAAQGAIAEDFLRGTPQTIAPFDAPQLEAQVTALPNGGWFVVWEEGFVSNGVILPEPPIDGRDTSLTSIVARVYDRDLQPVGEPFVVTEMFCDAQGDPAVAVDPVRGRILVTWTWTFGLTSTAWARELDLSGQPLGEEFTIADIGTYYAPMRAVAHPQGGWLVVGDGDVNLEAIRIAADGTVSTERTLASAVQLRVQPSLAILANGWALAAWSDRIGPESEQTARARWIDPAGVPSGGVVELGAIEPWQLALGGGAVRGTAGGPIWMVWEQEGGGAWQPATFAAAGEPPSLGVPIDTTGLQIERWFDLSGGGRLALAQDAESSTFWAFDEAFQSLGTPVEAERFGYGTTLAVSDDGRGVLIRPTLDDLTENLRIQSFEPGMLRERLYLGSAGRFELTLSWRDFDGKVGRGYPSSLTDESGSFWFFGKENVEVVVKVLDGRPINGHYWVYYGSLSNVEYTLTVTDTQTDTVKTFTNPLGQFGSFGDVEALPGD